MYEHMQAEPDTDEVFALVTLMPEPDVSLHMEPCSLHVYLVLELVIFLEFSIFFIWSMAAR